VPRLVLLHGALASSAQLSTLAAGLDVADVVAPDLAGHGARPDAGPYALDDFVDTVVAAIGDGPADLIGYSLGGYVALATAIARPGLVRRVVTVATKLAWTPEVAAAEAGRLDPDRLIERAPEFVAGLDAEHPGPGWRTVVARTAAFLTGLGTAPRLALDRVAVPVLVVVGADDQLVTLAECTEARDRLGDGRLAVLPGTGHAYERIEPDLLAATVAPFLGVALRSSVTPLS
jgi:pimeloyl-ACP methyl ester carboxylesterase